MVRLSPSEAEALIALADARCTSGAAILRQGLKLLAMESGILLDSNGSIATKERNQD
jgi:hypothetical protein